MRCYAFNKSTDKRDTYAKEVGEKLQHFGCGVVSIPPVVGRHARRLILRGPVVQEVGQQLGCPSCAVEALVEGSSKHWICQQSLISKCKKTGLIIATLVSNERFRMNVA